MLYVAQVSPAKLALRRHLSQEKLALESVSHVSGAGKYQRPHSRSSSTSSADLVIVESSELASGGSSCRMLLDNSRLPDRLLGERLAERGLEVIPTGPPPTPPTQPTPPILTTPPTLATPPTPSSSSQPPTTPVDMSLTSSKTISPRPNSRLNQLMDEVRNSPLTPEAALRQPYSPVSRPSSTEATMPSVDGRVTISPGTAYSRSKSPRGSLQQQNVTAAGSNSHMVGTHEGDRPHMPPPVPSPGRDGLEARLAQIHHKTMRTTPPNSSNFTSNHVPAPPHHHQLHPSIQHLTPPVSQPNNNSSLNTNKSSNHSASASAITSAIAAAATKYGNGGNRSSTLSPSLTGLQARQQQQQNNIATASSTATPPRQTPPTPVTVSSPSKTTNENKNTAPTSAGGTTRGAASTTEGADKAPVPVEGLAAALHARYLHQQKQQQQQQVRVVLSSLYLVMCVM